MATGTLPIEQHIYSTEIVVKNTAVNLLEQGWYYAIIQLGSELPSNAELLGAMWTTAFDAGIFIVPTANKRLCFMSNTQRTVTSGMVTVFYTLQ